MKSTKITWIGFLITLSALAIPTKTIAYNHNSVSESESQPIESRLSKIAKTLKERESKIKDDFDAPENIDYPENTDIAGWINGSRGGFLNRNGGGGFVNRNGGGGFLNRGSGWRDGGWGNGGWRDGGGFFNHRF